VKPNPSVEARPLGTVFLLLSHLFSDFAYVCSSSMKSLVSIVGLLKALSQTLFGSKFESSTNYGAKSRMLKVGRFYRSSVCPSCLQKSSMHQRLA
jgi:hypothetical protein